MIPLYNYDPAEDEREWGDANMEEEAELTVSEEVELVWRTVFF